MTDILSKLVDEFNAAVRAECQVRLDVGRIRSLVESDLVALFDSLQKRPESEKQVDEYRVRIRGACSRLFLDFVGSTPVVRFDVSDEFTAKSLRFGTNWFVGAGDAVNETVQSVLSKV